MAAKYFKLDENGLVRAYSGTDEDEPLSDTSEEMSQPMDTHVAEQLEHRFHWPRAAVLLFLGEIEKRHNELLKPHKKRQFFTAISNVLQEHGYPVTWEICERKWRGMQATYKKIVNKENISGTGHVHWDYFERMQAILASDPAYNTPATAAAGTSESCVIQPEARGAQAVSEKGKRKKKTTDRVQETLTEMQENITTLRTEIQEANRIQSERNQIMEKIATSLEKLSNS